MKRCVACGRTVEDVPGVPSHERCPWCGGALAYDPRGPRTLADAVQILWSIDPGSPYDGHRAERDLRDLCPGLPDAARDVRVAGEVGALALLREGRAEAARRALMDGAHWDGSAASEFVAAYATLAPGNVHAPATEQDYELKFDSAPAPGADPRPAFVPGRDLWKDSWSGPDTDLGTGTAPKRRGLGVLVVAGVAGALALVLALTLALNGGIVDQLVSQTGGDGGASLAVPEPSPVSDMELEGMSGDGGAQGEAAPQGQSVGQQQVQPSAETQDASAAPEGVTFVSGTGDAINLRSMPTHNSDLVIQIGSDTVMTWYGEQGTGYGSDGAMHTWYKVQVNGSVWGWARSDLIVST